jgi:uncharacterized RDD family membrane protein YckC
MPAWVSYAIGAVVAILIAILLAPYIPDPGGEIVAIIAYIVAAILAILAVFSLIRGPRVP